MINRTSMHLLAMEYYGLKEVPGIHSNPTIMRWFRDIGYTWVQGEETAWCSCFINWLAWKLELERSGKLTARSWLDVGEEVNSPELGHVAIFWRESKTSWKGHVGLYAGDDDDFIYCLGGNQGNQVNIKAMPIDRLLEFRSLKSLEV